MVIRPVEDNEYEKSLDFCEKVFLEQLSDTVGLSGCRLFEEHLLRLKMFSEAKAFAAFEDEMMVGVLAAINNMSHIQLLFVDSSYQKAGVGRALVEYFTGIANPSGITVNAYKNSVGFYEKCGFHAISGLENDFGIEYVKMFRKID